MFKKGLGDLRGREEDNSEKNEEENSPSSEPENNNNAPQSFLPSWKTKVFTLECIRKLLETLVDQKETFPEHFDLAAARNKQPPLEEGEVRTVPKIDFLVFHLRDLVTLSFNAATSPYNSIRTVGIFLLSDIVRIFSKTIDPDALEKESYILEQYQGQVGPAVRNGFLDNAGIPPSPSVTSAACEVLAEFLCSNVRYGETGCQKLIKLIIDNLEKISSNFYPMFSSKATTLLKLSVLTTFARLYTMESINKSNVIKCIESSVPELRDNWMKVLKDYVVISLADRNARRVYQGNFYESSYIISVTPFYEKRWGYVYHAACSLLSNESQEQVSQEHDFFILFGMGLRVLSKIHGEQVESSIKSVSTLLSKKDLLKLVFEKSMGEDLVTISNGLVHSTSNVKTKSASLLKNVIQNLDQSFFKEESAFDNTFSTLLSQIILPLDGLLPNFKLNNSNSNSVNSYSQPRSHNSPGSLSEKEVTMVLDILLCFESIEWSSFNLFKKHVAFLFHVIVCSLEVSFAHQNIHTQALKSFTSLINSSEKFFNQLKQEDSWKSTILSSLTSLSIHIFTRAFKEEVSSSLLSLFILSTKFDSYSDNPNQLYERDQYLANALRDALKSPIIKVFFFFFLTRIYFFFFFFSYRIKLLLFRFLLDFLKRFPQTIKKF